MHSATTRYIVELAGHDPNGRKMIAWGRRIGCKDVGHSFDTPQHLVLTRLLVDTSIETQFRYLLELVDNPTGLHAIHKAPL